MSKRETKAAESRAAGRVVLVGTYRKGQLQKWRGWYNYPVSAKDTIPESEESEARKRALEAKIESERKAKKPAARPRR